MIPLPEQFFFVPEIQLLEVGVRLEDKYVLLDDGLDETAHVWAKTTILNVSYAAASIIARVAFSRKGRERICRISWGLILRINKWINRENTL
jgi:hypothetical protein